MFGQKPIPRRLISQLFQRRRGSRFLNWTVRSTCLALLLPGLAYSQINVDNRRETRDQTTRNQSLPGRTQYPFKPPPKPSLWKTIKENMHGSYSVTMMGPRPVGPTNSTYNIFVPDVAPIQLYHSTSLFFFVNPDWTFGFGVDAVQNIANDVVGNTGIVRGQNFILYDPTLNITLPNLMKVPGWSVFTSANMSLAVTEASINIGRITSININQNWRVLTYPSKWSYGFDINLNPQFYTEPFPSTFNFRKTFYASIGHFLSYQISPQVSLIHTTTFDMDHRVPNETGFFQFSSGLDDRMRFAMRVSPDLGPLMVSFGGYFQFLMWNPQMDTSIFGMDFSVGF
jgi:hypothetical protein